MKYDVFISYRRGNGFFLAQIIKEYLAKRKINSFLDIEELHSGKFDKEILDAIKDTPNFILILTKGALARTKMFLDFLIGKSPKYLGEKIEM